MLNPLLQAKIAVILPPRERFRPADAGAVALTVHDFVLASHYREQITVLGGEKEPFADVPYQLLAPKWHWLIGRSLDYAYACGRWLKQSQAQVVEVHNRIVLALQLKRMLPQLTVIVHLHNDPHNMEGAKTAEQRQQLLQTLDGVYCVSDYVRQRLWTGVTGDYSAKTWVIYNALTTQPLTAEKKRWLVYAGRFIPEKGVLPLAQALAEVLPQYPDWQAVFLGAWGFGHTAGRTEYEQQVYAALSAVSAQVEFRGHVPQAEVMATFAQSMVVVMPSIIGEAFGRVALEAMLMRNALVVSNWGALPEVGGEAVIVLPEVNQTTLKQTLITLLAQPERCGQLADLGYERARHVFSLPAQVQRLDKIRQQFLHG